MRLKMPTIRVFVPGEPKAQPRPRGRAVTKTTPKGKRYNTVMAYNPKTADAWKIQIKYAFDRYKGLMILGPIICNVKVLISRPKQLMRKKDPAGEIPYIAKPDRDNLDKSILDCLSGTDKNGKGGIGVWKDDCQVYDGRVSKFYCAKDSVPGAWVEIIYGEEI